MRMGRHYSARERERRVQGVIAELGLKNCANTLIGWPNRLKGLSGGERKRLAFASEVSEIFQTTLTFLNHFILYPSRFY